MAHKFLTPDTIQITGNSIRRFFCVDAGLVHFLTGALDELTKDYNWQKFGDIPPVQMVEVFEDVIASMANCDAVGQVMAFFGNIPDYCLLLDGSSHDVDDYPILASSVPDWVTGSVITLPDLTDSYLVGADDADVGLFTGSNTHKLTVDEIPPHSHEYTTAAGSATTLVLPDEPSAVPAPAVTGDTGGGLAHNNMPHSIGVVWAVVAK